MRNLEYARQLEDVMKNKAAQSLARKWRMREMCSDCPFADSGPGLHLRKSLVRGRWREILRHLLHDGHFTCHQTTDDTGDGLNLICAGAIAWQEKHGRVGQLQRIMERLDYFHAKEE